MELCSEEAIKTREVELRGSHWDEDTPGSQISSYSNHSIGLMGGVCQGRTMVLSLRSEEGDSIPDLIQGSFSLTGNKDINE